MNMTRITGSVELPDGTAPTNGEVRFRLADWDRSGQNLIVPGVVVAPIAVDGSIDVELQVSEEMAGGSLYSVEVHFHDAGGQPRRVRLPNIAVPASGPVVLADLLATPAPAPTVPDALAQALASQSAAAASASAASVSATAALASRGAAEASAAAAGGSAAAALASQAAAAASAAAASVSATAATIPNIRTAEPTAVAALADVRLVPFELPLAATISRVIVTVTTADSAAKLFEVGIYSSTYALMAKSGPLECAHSGRVTVPLPETVLQPGRFFVGITTNSTLLRVAVNEFAGCEAATAAFPLPETAASPALATAAPALTIRGAGLPALQGLFSLETGRNVRVYGSNGSQPWGLNTSTFKMAYSVDSGQTFIDVMPVPPGALTTGNGICDLVVAGGKLYVLTNNLTLHESSDLTAAAVWTDISCPVAAGLRSENGKGRPYGIGALPGYIFIGEYTSGAEVRTTGKDPGPDPVRGPRILRFNTATREWALSGEFKAARHIHSFFVEGTSALWVSLGDAGWGSQIGLHRLTPAGIGAGSGGADSWLQWTTPVAPRTDHYPVDFVVATAASFNGESFPLKFLMTSDRPGVHLLEAARSGTVAGSVNIGVQLYQPSGRAATETVRSLIIDTVTKNAFFWTAETTDPAIWVSPPPYNQAVRLAGYSDPNLFRAVYSGGYVLMFNSRFRCEKFVGQS